jgi:hypothetical protein
VEVTGSNPVAPTIDFSLPYSHLRVAVPVYIEELQPDANPMGVTG